MAVYILQPSHAQRDLTSANNYGEIRFILPDPSTQASLQPGVVRRQIETELTSFNPDSDYITHIGGDPLGPILLGKVLGEMFPGRAIKMLRWERSRDVQGKRMQGGGYYVPVQFP